SDLVRGRVRRARGVTVMAEVVLLINAAPPESLNKQERMHWGERRRVRQRWKDEAAVAWLNAGRPRFHRPAVQYRVYYATHRRRDPDNVVASLKPVIDRKSVGEGKSVDLGGRRMITTTNETRCHT